MDTSLFSKYNKALEKRKSDKDSICTLVFEITNVELLDEEIGIEKKVLRFMVSSVKKMKLRNKELERVLQEQGFTIQW